MYDEESTCQLNYVIIISDGMMRNHGIVGINAKGQTAARVTALRNKGRAVKTLMVAYGDGIYDQGMRIFDELAYRGSCDATSVTEAASRPDCEPTIVARTPSQLKTLLSQKLDDPCRKISFYCTINYCNNSARWFFIPSSICL